MSQTVSLRKRLGAFAAGAALVLSPAPGRAGTPSAGQDDAPVDEDTFFLPVTARRFALPSGILIPYVVLVDVPPATPEAGHFVGLNVGALFGFAGRWMVDANVVPLVLSGSFRYGNPELGLSFQVVDSQPFEVGMTARAFFSSTGVVFRGVEPGAVVLARSGRIRLDVGAFLPVSTSGDPMGALGVTRVGLRVAVSGFCQLNDHFHVAVNSGPSFGDLGGSGDSFSLPLGLTAGFSTNIHGYWIDVLPFISFPVFYGKDGVNTDVKTLGLILDFSKKL